MEYNHETYATNFDIRNFRVKLIKHSVHSCKCLYYASGSFTNYEIKLRILNVYAQFVTDVDPDRLSDWLVQENVITVEQWQRIRLENLTKPDRCRALLSHLFSIQHPRAFLVVRQALSKENHYLLESIDKQEPGCGSHVQPEKQSVLQGYYSHFILIFLGSKEW